MSKLEETKKSIKEGVSVSKSGKKKKTFSKADYNAITKAMLNTPDYTVEQVGTKDGKVVTKEIKPVAIFREQFIGKVLKDFGVDAQEVEKIKNDYEFKNVEGLYEIVSESITEFMDADKKFDFITKKDFKGSLSLKDVAETTKTYKPISKDGSTDGAEFTVKTKKHRQLEKKSKAPAWLKEKF